VVDLVKVIVFTSSVVDLVKVILFTSSVVDLGCKGYRVTLDVNTITFTRSTTLDVNTIAFTRSTTLDVNTITFYPTINPFLSNKGMKSDFSRNTIILCSFFNV
jgi:hypothetical protein